MNTIISFIIDLVRVAIICACIYYFVSGVILVMKKRKNDIMIDMEKPKTSYFVSVGIGLFNFVKRFK